MMQFEFILVPVKHSEAAQAELNKILRTRRVLTVQKEFVNQGGNSFWAVAIEYLDRAGGDQKSPFERKQKVDYREVLSEADFALYSKLRELRKKIAESEGVPVYAILTNDQIAEMVTGKVVSKADISKIAGIGEAKIGKYAESFLNVMHADAHEESGKSVSKNSEL